MCVNKLTSRVNIKQFLRFFVVASNISGCSYLFLLKSFHQLGHATERHGEGQMGASVAVRYLDVLVAKVSFPLGVTADLVLAENVRYQVSLDKKQI